MHENRGPLPGAAMMDAPAHSAARPDHSAERRAAEAAHPRVRAHFPELDVMRGAAIIAVVYLHAYFGPWPDTARAGHTLLHIAHLFAHTAVPVFLFMSAFLQSRDRSDGMARFQLRKLQRIYLPALFWMFAVLAYRILDEGGFDRTLVKAFLLFDIAGQYYYLWLLVAFYAAFFVIRGWSERQLGVLTAVAFAVNLAMIVWYEPRELSDDFATLAYRNPATWVFFYAAGFYVGRRFGSLECTRALLRPALAAMAAIGAVYLVMGEAFDHYPTSYFGVSVFLFSCCALVAYPALIQRIDASDRLCFVLRPFAALAPYSFAIYLVHMPFFLGYATNYLVPFDGPLGRDYFLLVHSLFVVALLTCTAAVVLVSKLTPRLAEDLLGVDPRRT